MATLRRYPWALEAALDQIAMPASQTCAYT